MTVNEEIAMILISFQKLSTCLLSE